MPAISSGRRTRALSNLARFAVVAFAVSALLAACAGPPTSATPRPDLELRVVGEDGCTGCDRFEMEGGMPPIYLDRVIVQPRDFVLVRIHDPTSVWFEFSPAAHERIALHTQRNIGKRVALVAGDKVVSVATLRGPFSAGMMSSGLEPAEREALIADTTFARK